MSRERWVPPTPPSGLFADIREITQAQTAGVWLGLGDIVHIASAPAAGNPGTPLVWCENLSLIFANPNSYDSRAVCAGDIFRLNKDGVREDVWGVEMPKTTPATAVRVCGTLALSEVQALVAARWPRHEGLDAVSLLCADNAVREPRWYSIAADLRLVRDPVPYRGR